MEALDHIIMKVAEGDSTAFTKLYNHYKEPGIRFSMAIVKDEEEAENMLHEVFIKIWNRREQINPELNFNSYIFTCLRNLAFDYLKKMERSQTMQHQYLQMMEDDHHRNSDTEEAKIVLLRNAMNSLPAKRKMILKLNVEDGKSYQEIAEMMRISKNTVKNQLVKAKQYLRGSVDLALAL
ncbi:RNA polymerase sigma factor [Emticicia sp. C21]|uniref:RNA polymerase sigma factor n=1 Tax=Emticicia sp. C21 TaxID=2302915 RepID=UPI000E356042|nr:RNA polymerase sigma-70 factor [Emticicia sp. C21]RFS18177.1 RNA polymerase sigma-70 factor [Emticicia sp. C21]